MAARAALQSYLLSLDRIFGGSHYLLDANGVDVLASRNRSALLPLAPATTERIREHGRWVVAHKAPDGLYWFAAEGQIGRPQVSTFLPYYFLVIGATSVLCWLASIGVISPIRRHRSHHRTLRPRRLDHARAHQPHG